MQRIHNEFVRCETIVGTDNRKRKIKGTNGGAKEPFATDEEIARSKFLCAQLRESSAAFADAAHQLVTLRDTFGLRQAKRANGKKVVRHCAHCAGRSAACGCGRGCNRVEGSKCYSHCKHCSGFGDTCSCTEGCANVRESSKCQPKSTAGSA